MRRLLALVAASALLIPAPVAADQDEALEILSYLEVMMEPDSTIGDGDASVAALLTTPWSPGCKDYAVRVSIQIMALVYITRVDLDHYADDIGPTLMDLADPIYIQSCVQG